MNIVDAIIKELKKETDEKYKPSESTIIWYDPRLMRNRIRIDTNKIEKKL